MKQTKNSNISKEDKKENSIKNEIPEEKALKNQNQVNIINETENADIINDDTFLKNEIINDHNTRNYISIESSSYKYDLENYSAINNKYDIESKKIKEDMKKGFNKTSNDKQEKYNQELLTIINSLNKTNIKSKLPVLPYGKSLTDEGFLYLLRECINYANYKFDELKLEYIKNDLLNNANVKNLFKKIQIVKDVYENSIISILASNNLDGYNSNYGFLKCDVSTNTPFIELDFNNNKLNKEELINIFCSPVYLQKFRETLSIFTNNIKNDESYDQIIETHIKNYFNSHYIYFFEMPKNVFTLSIHTGNIYITINYLKEYYSEKTDNDCVIIRQKIILNIAHELTHMLLREIDDGYKKNFLIKSKIKNKRQKDLQFKKKFVNSFYPMEADESGNMFDYKFLKEYYFDDLYEDEAILFLNIKNYRTVQDYEANLEKIISEEKLKSQEMLDRPIYKFKKLDQPRRCFKSKILGNIDEIKEECYNDDKLMDEVKKNE